MEKPQQQNVIRVSLLFVVCGLCFGLCFLALDSLPALKSYWYTYDKGIYLIPRPIYHFTGCFSLLLSIVLASLIAIRKGCLNINNNRRRIDFVALAVFALLPC